MFTVNFHESEHYLLSLGNEVSTMKLGLENIRMLLDALGSPHEKYPKVQVAGTNGKGSVCGFLSAICIRAGIRTGMFTSPHLISVTERIQIDGAEISKKEFAVHASRVRTVGEELVAAGRLESVPTFFEQITAIALLSFAEAKVELAILETGLGGRLDATTAADADVAVITRIDYDHQQYLGDTIQQIAAEKAAIIHGGSKVVALRQDGKVEQVILGRCKEVGVDPTWATRDILIKREPEVGPFLIATFMTETTSYGNVEFMHMRGEHQIENASVAIAAAEVLASIGLLLSRDAIIAGLENASHPGRLEHIGRFILDGAHNRGGALALREYLDEFVRDPITMIFGSMSDKDVKDIASILFPAADRIILTRPENSRAMPPDELLDIVPAGVDPRSVLVSANLYDALEIARKDVGVIVVTGSLYLVGEAKKRLTVAKGYV